MSSEAAPLILGAHLSTAGGLHQALERALELRCSAVQLFTHNRAQWKIKPLDRQDVQDFRELKRSRGPFALAAHSSYLVNPASPDRALRERSIKTLITELDHCEQLGIPSLVFHPGAHMGAGERQGLQQVARALNRIHQATEGIQAATVIETTAGQGTGLGWRFEQIAAIFEQLEHPDRAGVCLDTAHVFAAGYDMRTPEQYEALWSEFDQQLGLERLVLLHLNDSRKTVGSRVDRHAHIGQGEIGRSPFGWIMADERLHRIAKVLETPKEDEMDKKNLAMLRRLAKSTPPHRGRPQP